MCATVCIITVVSELESVGPNSLKGGAVDLETAGPTSTKCGTQNSKAYSLEEVAVAIILDYT